MIILHTSVKITGTKSWLVSLKCDHNEMIFLWIFWSVKWWVTEAEHLVTQINWALTLILPTPKAISLCHQYKARPACIPCSLTRLYTVVDHLQVFIWISLKLIMDSAKKWRWIIPFMKFGRVRVNRIISQSYLTEHR